MHFIFWSKGSHISLHLSTSSQIPNSQQLAAFSSLPIMLDVLCTDDIINLTVDCKANELQVKLPSKRDVALLLL